MPPTAGETMAVISSLTSFFTFSASALHSLAVRLASWNTSAFCRNLSEWRPLDRMKWPSSNAPDFLNSASTCSTFILFPLLTKAGLDPAIQLVEAKLDGRVDPAHGE